MTLEPSLKFIVLLLLLLYWLLSYIQILKEKHENWVKFPHFSTNLPLKIPFPLSQQGTRSGMIEVMGYVDQWTKMSGF